MCVVLLTGVHAAPSAPDPKTIIQKSVEANQRDFEAGPHFSYTKRESTGKGFKTCRVVMIDGSPYERTIAIGGKPLSHEADLEEERKLHETESQRRSESAADRKKRIDKYNRDRNRDHAMMAELTKAFTFKLLGQHRLGSFTTYVLKATPRLDYQPPNMETQALRGMAGQLWIDTKTFQWVKVTAQVIHPTSIEGFLAQVEPGTRFELEKAPVQNGIWMPKHFAMQSQAKVLFMVNHSSEEEDFFSDYKPVQ